MTKVRIKRNVTRHHITRRGIERDVATDVYTETEIVNIGDLAKYLNATPPVGSSGTLYEGIETHFSEWRIDEVIGEPEPKVKLPKEVADAIESFRSQGWQDFFLVQRTFDYTQNPHATVEKEVASLRKHFASSSDEKKLFSALVNGYEVEEKSPKDIEVERYEKVREYYESVHAQVYNGSFAPVIGKSLELNAIMQTLDLLGIKIEGVND